MNPTGRIANNPPVDEESRIAFFSRNKASRLALSGSLKSENTHYFEEKIMMVKVSPNVAPQKQPLATCCWLTCLEMMFNWKNSKGDKSKKASSILDLMDRSPNLFPYYMVEAGIAPGECRETARMLGLRASGDTSQLDAATLAEMLKNHGPLWIAGRWYRNFNHVIVLTGCDPDSGKVKYIDPWENWNLSESDNSVAFLSKRGPVWTNCDASIMYWP